MMMGITLVAALLAAPEPAQEHLRTEVVYTASIYNVFVDTCDTEMDPLNGVFLVSQVTGLSMDNASANMVEYRDAITILAHMIKDNGMDCDGVEVMINNGMQYGDMFHE